MYQLRTVFILGAGASWHYGYPTGESLVQEIRQNAERMAGYCKMMRRHDTRPEWPSFIESLDDWTRWQTDLASINKSLREADPLIIDYFLSKNEQYREVGTLLIALTIMAREERYRQFGNRNLVNRQEGNPNSALDTLPNDNWMRFICHRLIDTAANSEDLFSNNVHFVTFNYDTSLESALYLNLRNHSAITPNHMMDFVTPQRIIHVYGSIRDEPPRPGKDRLTFDIPTSQPDRDVRLVLKESLEVAYSASQRLSLIQSIKDGPACEAARKVIKDAEEVFILGYGFDALNNKRIGLDRLTNRLQQHQPARIIHYTNFNGSRRIQRTARSLFFGKSHAEQQGIGEWTSPDGRVTVVESPKNVYEALALDFEH